MKISQPGIYRGISDADYRLDPCPAPSLTQSLAKTIVATSPRHAWVECPSLNPSYERDDETKFDIGNIAHRLILGRGKEIEVLPFADWRKDIAKEAREAAAAEGKIGVLLKDFERSTEMAAAAWSQLRHHEDSDAFSAGAAEVMIAWQEGGIWFRALVDWLHDDLRTVDDYKSTAMSVAPHLLGMRAEAGGWHIQHAFIERGLAVLDPAGAGRRRYRNIAQENYNPFALNVMHMDEHWLTMGRKNVDAAVMRWKHAVETDDWFGYPNRGIRPEFPGFKENQFLEREVNEFSEPIKRGPMLKSLMGG